MPKSKKFSSNRAITLIALVITIVVMLILVAVTVTILVESDLIGSAEKAGNAYKSAQAQEETMSQITINNETYASINDYMNKNPIDEGPETYVLSGKWKIDKLVDDPNVETLALGGFVDSPGIKPTDPVEPSEPEYTEEYTEEVSFECNGSSYTGIDYKEGSTMVLYFVSGETKTTICDSNGWKTGFSNDIIVDFGAQGQEVTETFYNWFTSVATRQYV